MKIRVSIFLLLVLFLAAFSLRSYSQDIASLIADGDRFSTVTFENDKALEKFLQAEKIEPNNYEVLWRISRSYVDIGEHQPSKTSDDKKNQLATYLKALDYAERAVKANPNGTMGYTRRAIANGRVALFKGVWDSIDLVKQVRADCEKAIQLDDKNASVYYVLARTHLKLCEKPKIIRWPLGLSWANLDDAVVNFEKAVSLRPNFIMYRLDGARAYIELDNYAKARTLLTSIATLPKEDEDDDTFRTEAQDLLNSIKDK